MCSGSDADDVSHVRSVVTSILEGCDEILGHILRGLEVIGRVVASEPLSFSVSGCHGSFPLSRLLPLSCRGLSGSCSIHFERTFDIRILSALCPTAEQQEHNSVRLCVVHAVSRTVVDPHLTHAGPDWLHIAWIAHGESVDPCGYARPGVRIVEIRKPRIERGRAAD